MDRNRGGLIENLNKNQLEVEVEAIIRNNNKVFSTGRVDDMQTPADNAVDNYDQLLEREAEAILENISDESSSVCINNGEQSEDVSNEISASTTLSTTVREGKPVDISLFIPKTKKTSRNTKNTRKRKHQAPKGLQKKMQVNTEPTTAGGPLLNE